MAQFSKMSDPSCFDFEEAKTRFDHYFQKYESKDKEEYNMWIYDQFLWTCYGLEEKGNSQNPARIVRVSNFHMVQLWLENRLSYAGMCGRIYRYSERLATISGIFAIFILQDSKLRYNYEVLSSGGNKLAEKRPIAKELLRENYFES
jgi:hypothetical protein